jgi:hypothetical protein
MADLKNLSKLEHKIGDKVFHFLCDQDSPLNQVKDALLNFLGFVAQVEKAAQDEAAKKAAEASPVAEMPIETVTPEIVS